MLYRCACGCEFQVDPTLGGICNICRRRISAIALKLANSATLSLDNLAADPSLEHRLEGDLDLAQGTMLGHFRLDKAIGRGGMGAVYRALDTSLERYVAVKVMRPGSDSTDLQIAAMLREAVAQARLNHPNVVTIYYIGRHEQEPFLAMELVQGETLSEKIKAGPISYAEGIRISIEVIEALHHAYCFDIVHADIKPSNLLISHEGTVKLSDFGLSRTTAVEDSDQPIAGTPAYIAPELLDGCNVSIQSDMYAMGVTLFETVFGRLPFTWQGTTLREQLLTHKTAKIDFPTPWPTHIPRDFALVLERMLAKRPEDRYADYQSLLRALRSIQPTRMTTAGIAARSMAYGIDQSLLLFCISPFAALIAYLNVLPANFRWLIPIVALASVVVPATYLTLLRRGWSSLGRYLFQLRITEENGLPPRREQLLAREILRNMMAWLLPLGAYFSLFYDPVLPTVQAFLAFFLLAELACLFVTSQKRTLHDLLCRSQVVLDVGRPMSAKRLSPPK